MKFFRRLSKPYSLGTRAKSLSIKDRPYLLPVVGLVLGIILVGIVIFYGNRTHPLTSDAHVVYIFDNGKRLVVDTKANTVGQLVGKLPLELTKQDLVEPSANTQIVQDNFRVNIYRARPVTVIVGGQRTVALTGERDARLVAQAAGLTVYPEDIVTFEPGQVNQGVLGEEVKVVPALPVKLNLYGTSLTVRTQAKTVAGLLAEKGIVLSKGDSVMPKLNDRLGAKSQVFVIRKNTKIVTVAEVAPVPVHIVKDPSLTFGASVVRQPGLPGKKLVTYEIITINGHAKRKQIQAAVVQEPVTEIIAQGTNVDIPKQPTTIMASAGVSPSDYAYADYIISHESGWCYTKWQGQYGGCQAYHGAPSYGGYGLCQATPPGKMVSAGSDWAWNPITQMRWCSGYAASRYGGWANAYNHWLANGNW